MGGRVDTRRHARKLFENRATEPKTRSTLKPRMFQSTGRDCKASVVNEETGARPRRYAYDRPFRVGLLLFHLFIFFNSNFFFRNFYTDTHNIIKAGGETINCFSPIRYCSRRNVSRRSIYPISTYFPIVHFPNVPYFPTVRFQ